MAWPRLFGLARFYCQPIKWVGGWELRRGVANRQANMLGPELIWPAATINSNKASQIQIRIQLWSKRNNPKAA